VTIEVTVAATSPRTVVLHAHQLSVHGVAFAPAAGAAAGAAPLTPDGIAYDLKAQTVTFTFPSALPSGPGSLTAAFSGALNDELAGFYRSRYVSPSGETRYMAVTQLEATDARRVFPCVDEPAAKASFKVTVEAPAARQVVSNMPAVCVSTSGDGARRTHVFAETPVMSTYLVAVCVGEWDVVSALTPTRRIPVSVFTPVGKSAQGAFALRVAVGALDFLEHTFGMPYIGTKADHIPVPDMAAGAMENLGAVVYREAALLIDEAQSSLAARQRVAQVVCHETSHFWFGDTTTMAWWDGLWLNEGFAKHMEYVCTEHLFPDWGVWALFSSSVQSAAFHLDAMASTHPVEVPVSHPDEINEIFDAISYNKGASLIRMLFDWLGHEAGFKGLSAYLREHAFKNTVTTQLWQALEAASGQPVAAVMRRWTGTSGHPYLHIAPAPGGGFTLASRRCTPAWARNGGAWPTDAHFASGASFPAAAAAAAALAVPPPAGKEATEGNDDWCLPISVALPGGGGAAKVGVLLLDPDAAPAGAGSREDRLAAMAASLAAARGGAPWMKVNAGHTAFYRTLYDGALLTALEAAVATPAPGGGGAPALPTTDRLGLMGDVAAGVAIGATPASDLLRFARAFLNETDYAVWVAVIDALSDLRTSAASLGADAVGAMDEYTRYLLARIVARVGWEAKAGEHPNTALLRALVLRIAAMANDAPVVAEALARFDAYAAGKGGIAADLKQLVYNTAASHGGAGRWEALLKLYKAASMSEEQRRLLTALGRAADPALLQRTLGMTLTEEVRSQDAAFVFMAVASNPGEGGRAAAWAFLKGHWDAVKARMGGGNFIWSSLIGAATSHFDSRAAADDVAAWFAAHPAGSAERTVQQALETARSRAWKAHLLARDPAGFVATARALVGTTPACLA
jgi:puromycin-sensitive aminopeptidase